MNFIHKNASLTWKVSTVETSLVLYIYIYVVEVIEQ